MGRIHVDAFMPAPVDVVFAYFDDPDNTLEFNDHAESFEVIASQPDGRRTIDVVMRAGRKQWMQTVETVVREPPTRLVTRGGTWTVHRDELVLVATTDRVFSADGDGTRVDVIFDYQLAQPSRRPFWAVLGWLQKGATKRQLEQQLDQIAERLAWRAPKG